MSFNEEEFFSEYRKTHKKPEGIPYLEMNCPVGVQSKATGLIGLELEIEGINLPGEGHLEQIVSSETKSRWKAAPDGSLRGENLEYVLNKPTSLDEAIKMVNLLYDAFKRRGTVLTNSNRCSTHVHINMKNKKIHELTSILALWMVFEKALIKWNGEERESNHFCLSSNDSPQVAETWERFLREGAANWAGGLKYSSLNILPLFNLGSFEFRCGAPPNNPEQVISWFSFLVSMVEFAVEKYPNPLSISYDLSERGAFQILEEICERAEKPALTEEIISSCSKNIEEFEMVCMSGFRNAQPFIAPFPWENWIEMANKEYVPNPFKTTKKATMVRRVF